MYTFYIVFEKHSNDRIYKKSWVIRKTKNDLCTTEGISNEIKLMEREYDCQVWIINWKRLDVNNSVEI